MYPDKVQFMDREWQSLRNGYYVNEIGTIIYVSEMGKDGFVVKATQVFKPDIKE